MENTAQPVQPVPQPIEQTPVHLPPKPKLFTKKVIGLCTVALLIMAFGIGILILPATKLNPTQESLTSQSKTAVTSAPQKTVSQVTFKTTQLAANAGSMQDVTTLPLGDNKYTTTGPKKGYIYLCNARSDEGGGGAQANGPWITGSTWNLNKKIVIQGKVSWPNAAFSNKVSGSNRVLAGNDLPLNGMTGTFPVQSSDPAYAYDKNPNTIKTQQYSDTFPVNPTAQTTPSCMGGEVGVMLNGVSLFNGFDATLRDAAAHEVQDSCQGHPQKDGQYHYHSLSSCFGNISTTAVIGFALDGFPITGPKLESGKYLTTSDLDECHGTTSKIILDGKQTTMYHYVMTQDFPYSVSCFRGKPVSMQVIAKAVQNGAGQQQMTLQGRVGGQNNGQQMQPPQEAFSSCSGKAAGAACSFSTPNGTLSGNCKVPPQQSSLVCVPSGR
jgi:hypothetical protein